MTIFRYLAGGVFGVVAAVVPFEAAVAATESFESQVTIEQSATPAGRAVLHVRSPAAVEYTVERTPDQIDALIATIRANPDAVIRIEGDVVEGPSRTFRMTRWERSVDPVDPTARGTYREERTYRREERTTD